MIPTLPEWPMFGLADDARPFLRTARERGMFAALATITALGGGGPRPVGTQMVISGDLVSGFLSGGCLESDVAGHAAQVLEDGAARRLVYGEGSPWPDIRLLCGARIEILVERILPDDPAVGRLLQLTEARAPALWISDGGRRECAHQGEASEPWPGAFARTYEPVLRLIVLGSDPTALAIAQLGAQAGCETTLIRPKGPIDAPTLSGVGYRRGVPPPAHCPPPPGPWLPCADAPPKRPLAP